MPFVSSLPPLLSAPSRTAWAPASARAIGPVVSASGYHRSRRVHGDPISSDTEAPPAGNPFARKRLHHTMEMFGSCMMIVAFLALAILA
jgi:hypothetical protein